MHLPSSQPLHFSASSFPRLLEFQRDLEDLQRPQSGTYSVVEGISSLPPSSVVAGSVVGSFVGSVVGSFVGSGLDSFVGSGLGSGSQSSDSHVVIATGSGISAQFPQFVLQVWRTP